MRQNKSRMPILSEVVPLERTNRAVHELVPAVQWFGYDSGVPTIAAPIRKSWKG